MGRILLLLAKSINTRAAIWTSAIAAVVIFFVWLVFGSALGRQFGTNAAATSNPKAEISEPHQDTSVVGNTLPNGQGQTDFLSNEPAQNQSPSFAEEMQKVKAEGFQNRIKQLVSDLDKLSQDFTDWIELTSDLAANDSGRRMANNPKDLPAIKIVLETKQISQTEISTLKEEVKLIERHAALNPLALPSNDLLVAVDKASNQIGDAQKLLDEAVLSIGYFEKSSAKLQPSKLTLMEAIIDLESARSADSSKKIAEKIALLEKEENAKELERQKQLMAARGTSNEQKYQDDLKILESKKEAVRLEAEARSAEQVLEAEYRRDLPQIEKFLGPMFVHGYSQPSGNGITFHDTTTFGPLSLSAIAAYGCLGEPEGDNGNAYSRLLHIFREIADSDRKTKGPYPHYIGAALKESEREAIRPAYGYLQKYQHLLVKKGKLAK